jgi:hypothetical protein
VGNPIALAGATVENPSTSQHPKTKSVITLKDMSEVFDGVHSSALRRLNFWKNAQELTEQAAIAL